ncbi:antiterminator Q family protein [Erwinia psidii]|uniref:antiterminator Q family protein n=1 Tax=Erwinia psidii TaxID=69224 RepID=UPI00226B5813|nr:antiterminator Q family protein [Erwinia psidii]
MKGTGALTCMPDSVMTVARELAQRKLDKQGPQALNGSDKKVLDIMPSQNPMKQKRPDAYDLLFSHYVKDISKRALGRKLKLSEGMIRIKFRWHKGL